MGAVRRDGAIFAAEKALKMQKKKKPHPKLILFAMLRIHGKKRGGGMALPRQRRDAQNRDEEGKRFPIIGVQYSAL